MLSELKDKLVVAMRKERRYNCIQKTLNNFLLWKDYKFQKQIQCILLSKDHKEKRVAFVLSWIDKNIDFKNWVFIDEKRFKMDGPDNWYI